LLMMIQTSCSLSQRPLLNGRRLYLDWRPSIRKQRASKNQ
jgi:hypothetical protein